MWPQPSWVDNWQFVLQNTGWATLPTQVQNKGRGALATLKVDGIIQNVSLGNWNLTI
jgi:hypothetical protein